MRFIRKVSDLTGQTFGRLFVVGLSDRRTKDGKKLWECVCNCDSYLPMNERKRIYATDSNLKRGASEKKGGTASCGCLAKEVKAENGRKNKKHNEYDLDSKEYGIGYVDNSDYCFYFDKEDYKLIAQYCWHKHQDGYLRTCIDNYKDENGKRHNKYIMMHQLLGIHYKIGNGKEVDHKNGKVYDNRKSNLRESTHSLNMKNTKLFSTNKSGHKGVRYSKRENKWKAYIQCNKQKIHLGTFALVEQAIEAREEAEKKYFGEFSREKQFLLNGTR